MPSVEGEAKKEASGASLLVAAGILFALMIGSFVVLGKSDPTGCALGAAATGTIAAATSHGHTIPAIVGSATAGPACTVAVRSMEDERVRPARSRDGARPRPQHPPAR
jgi:hypothetical protein